MKRAIGLNFLQNIGDNVVSWIACQALKRLYPDVKIDMLIPGGRESLYELNCHIDRLYTMGRAGRGLKRVKHEFTYLRELAANKYDLAFAMDYKEATIAKIFTLTPNKRGYCGNLFWRNLFKLYPEQTELKAGNLRSQVFLDNLARAGLAVDYTQHLDLLVKPEWIEAANGLCQFELDKVAVYCPYGAGPPQDMREETYDALLQHLVNRFPKVYLIGAQYSQKRLEELCRRNGLMQKVQILIDVPFTTLAALLKTAKLCLSVDTGPMHIADAVGARVIGMYGSAEIIFRHWQIFGKNSMAVQSDQPGHFYNFPPEIAIAAIEKMIGIEND